jgi:hypothetical protein
VVGLDATPLRLELSADGPLGMAIRGSTGWVVATDGGRLLRIDLAAVRELESVDVGPAGQQVVLGRGEDVFVGRYDLGSSGFGVLRVARGGAVTGLKVGAIGGLAVVDDGTVWALETSGRLVHLDPTDGRTLAAGPITIQPNEHLDLLAGGGALWASSDHTPVRRIAPNATVAATIETGGGIPLAFDAGFAWGARPDAIWAIDPATNRVAREVVLVGIAEILAMEVSDGVAWVGVRRPGGVGRVVGIDLADGSLLAEYPTSLPAAVELTPDRVWVTDYDSDAVLGFPRVSASGG